MNIKSKLLKDYLAEYWLKTKGFSSQLFINYKYPDKLRSDIAKISNIVCQNAEYFEFDIGDYDLSPYYPFFQIIKSVCPEIGTLEKKIHSSKIPVYHKKLIFSWIKHGEVELYEEFLPEDITYEKNEICESILEVVRILLLQRKTVIVISNIQYSRESTLRIIPHLISGLKNIEALFIFTFNRQFHFAEDEIVFMWDDFISNLQQNQSYKDIDLEETNLPMHSVKPMIYFEISVLLTKIVSLLNSLAFDESLYNALKLLRESVTSQTKLSEQAAIELQLIIADIYYYMGDYGSALTYCQNIYKEIIKPGYEKELPVLLRRLAYLHYKKDNHQLSSRYIQLSQELSISTSNEKQLALSYFDQLALEGNTIHFLETKETAFHLIFEKCLSLLTKFEFNHRISFLMSSAPFLYTIYVDHNKEMAFELSRVGLEKSLRLKNRYRIAAAYHTSGLLFQEDNDWEKALKNYKRSLTVRKGIGDYLEMARICNGISYFYLSKEQFVEANTYCLKAIKYLSNTEAYEEIATTLFNLACIDFFAFNYKACIDLLEKVLFIMNMLGIKDLTFAPRINIYSYLGMSYLKLGRVNIANDFMYKIHIITRNNSSRHLYIAHMYFNSMFLWFNGNIPAAIIDYTETLNLAKKKSTGFNLIKKNILLDCCELFLLSNDSGSARSYALDGIAFCKNTSVSTYYKKIFSNILKQSKVKRVPLKLKHNNYNLDYCIKSIKQNRIMMKLHQKIDEINLLNSLQTILLNTFSEEKLLAGSVNLFSSSLLFDVTIFFKKLSDRFAIPTWKIVPEQYSDLSLYDINDLNKFDNEILGDENNVDKSFKIPDCIKSYIYIPMMRRGELYGGFLCASCRSNFIVTDDHKRIISIASNQIVNAIIKIELDLTLIEKNKELFLAATTDSLTGLKNRSDFVKRLELEIKRVKRFSNSENEKCGTLLFIDLDNFKYCNDTFGHQSGDLVLKEFALILQKAVREIDVIGRIGGDEFVIILPETNIEGATNVAQRIITTVTLRENFKNEISHNVGRKIEFPSDKLITCSIGIAILSSKTDVDPEQALKTADNALYNAKKRGKGQYVVIDNSI